MLTGESKISDSIVIYLSANIAVYGIEDTITT